MEQDTSVLSAPELDRVKNLIKLLIKSLTNKKGVTFPGGLLPDEAAVYNALTHPERGDVVVTIVQADENLQIFISNRRDENTPFAVMELLDIHKYPHRRTLDGTKLEPVGGRAGLFLVSYQDQELLKNESTNIVDFYSSALNLVEREEINEPEPEINLKTKKLSECSYDEKWKIYIDDQDMDNRREAVENELFGFTLRYCKYNQKEKEERLLLTPEKYKYITKQLIRDIYPVGVKDSLERDFPGDHKKKIQECQLYLTRLKGLISSKIQEENGEGYNNYLTDLEKGIENILKNDPEFSRL